MNPLRLARLRVALLTALGGALVLVVAASPPVALAGSKPKVTKTISWWPSKWEYTDPDYDPDDPNHNPANHITEMKVDAGAKGAKSVRLYLHKKGLPPTVKAVRSDEQGTKLHHIGKGYKHWVATVAGDDADPVYQYLLSPNCRATVKACNAAGCTTTPPFDQ